MCWGTSSERQWRIMAVRRRDGFCCWLCGDTFKRKHPKGRVTIDHAIPRGRGGTNHISNLRLAHEECNNDRGMIVDTGPRAHRTRAEQISLTMRKTSEPERMERLSCGAGQSPLDKMCDVC